MSTSNREKQLQRQAEEAGCAGLLQGSALNVFSHKKFYAGSAVKSDGPFYCAECLSDAVVRKCVEKIDHFAHVARLSPILSPGESKLHDECKKSICGALAREFPTGLWATERPIPENAKLEVPKLVPDISGNIMNQRVAIEIQLSRLSLSQIIKRTVSYSKRKIPILWVVPLQSDLGNKPFRPRQFEKYLHSMYFGRVYYWWPELGARVMPVHFTRTKRKIPYSEWYENGEHCEAGGYEKAYKTLKLPSYGCSLSVSDNFVTRPRMEFVPDNEKKSVPACLIWHDKLAPWWDSEAELIEANHDDDTSD